MRRVNLNRRDTQLLGDFEMHAETGVNRVGDDLFRLKRIQVS